MGTRILAVEDDERIRTAVKMALEDEGWVVEEAETGEDALEAFARKPSDVVLIDIMLPGVDGFEVCRSLRRTSDVPIVMVTARADTHDVVAGLDAGADDYLVKPFALDELLARLRAFERRSPSAPQARGTLSFEDVTLDRDAMVARRGGHDISLTRTEYQLLELLMANPRRVLSRDVIFEKVWGYDFGPESNSLDVYIGYLRRKLESGGETRLIHTVRSVGYVLREAP